MDKEIRSDAFVPPRTLSDAEVEKLASHKETLTSFQLTKLEKEAAKNWDLFYKRNQVNFFKDRHWLEREFSPLVELMNTASDSSEIEAVASNKNFMELGCGVGNAFFPIMESMPPNVRGFACDFSKRAVEFVQNHTEFNPNRMDAFQCDIVNDDLATKVEPDVSFDVVTLIFVLSAIHPDKMQQAVNNLACIMKIGGKVCARDYAVNDHAMLRFGSIGHKLGERFYVRQDNTRAFYFYIQELEQLFNDAGFKTLDAKYVESKTVNHKEGVSVDRFFVQGVFQKT